jgi:hypothetical protein
VTSAGENRLNPAPVGRQFDEHEPAKRCVCRKHLAAADVFGGLDLLHSRFGTCSGSCAYSRPRSGDLCEPRHVRVAQNETDIGMGDEALLRRAGK